MKRKPLATAIEEALQPLPQEWHELQPPALDWVINFPLPSWVGVDYASEPDVTLFECYSMTATADARTRLAGKLEDIMLGLEPRPIKHQVDWRDEFLSLPRHPWRDL